MSIKNCHKSCKKMDINIIRLTNDNFHKENVEISAQCAQPLIV